MSEVKTPEIDLEAFAKKVAEETAAKIAMKQAEEKAAIEAEQKSAAEAQAAKAAQEEEVKSVIQTGIESGADRLMKDFEAKLNEKDANFQEVIANFQKDLEEKNAELTAIRESKRVFADRDAQKDLSGNKDVMYAHLLGVMTNKGWNTDYARNVFEKAGVDYAGGGNAPDIAQAVSTMIEKEIQLELRTANLFREMAVNSKTTVIPLQTDVNEATWSTGGENASASAGVLGTNVTNRDDTDAAARTGYLAKQKILTVDRLISTTFMDNYIDEEVLVNLMPMLTQGIARSHARAVDKSILQGNGGNIPGLNSLSVGKDISWSSTTQAAVTARDLVSMRRDMGVYGLNPQDLVYIVSQEVYHDLINDAEFDNVFEVGSDAALKLTGQVGAVYGTPVVISDNFPGVTPSAGQNVGAFCVNPANFIIPRLRGVSIEQDYEVAAQRRLIVGSQHLGFDELFNSVTGKAAAVRLNVKA